MAACDDMIRQVRSELRYWRAWFAVHTYWIRPFDATLDRRRWRWARPGCGLGRVSPEMRDALLRAVHEHIDRRDDTGRGGPT